MMANSNVSSKTDYWVAETVSLLTLSLLQGVGYWTIRSIALSGLGFKQILKAESNAEFINYLLQSKCKNTSQIANQIGENWLQKRDELWKQGVKLYHNLDAQGIKVIHFGQEDFPQTLREIADPPKWLFVQGNISILHKPALAIVGTRKPSEDGIFLANYVGACLQYFNAVTVSGLALGIDQIVHKKSIRAKVPTIAFIGTGILQNYPAGSEKLRQDICEHGGAIVSEYLPNQSYSAENFVNRNRLQAGLAEVVIPIEWKVKSGTAHTVNFANKAKKMIVCLRLPDWAEAHEELILAKKLDAEIFTLPGDEQLFINVIKQRLKKQTSNFSLQEQNIKVITKDFQTTEQKLDQQSYEQLKLF
ncbi:DNA-processing protein DprA [Nostoc sp. FACHB-190]|uniref:DNA-processing protein DprA n=1 Tax=Nostoc sp. FACHB-190 TaxID=2692838 RepID=UPI001687540C|nr:DNA-processing protein DprA [Nostoc sp. FACHB-190]MBD2302823.1 DNA-protecting protein DprA [Nostoc sp. FACHB-190]